MPKIRKLQKGDIIYFEGKLEDRLFILQTGAVSLSYIDIETKKAVSEPVGQTEFFGARSALGHFPREETAIVAAESSIVEVSMAEFEQIFSKNKAVIMKMLRVFSRQLRQYHKKTESILNQNSENADLKEALFEVAKAFLDDEQFMACANVCEKYLRRYPDGARKPDVARLYESARRGLYGQKKYRKEADYANFEPQEPGKRIELPGFERFVKFFEPGQVVIAEFEPGETFYFIQSGRVQLTKLVNGTSKNLDELKPGEFFGEMAILDNSPRSATCMAKTRLEVLEFNKSNFELLVGGNPQIALILLKLFCKRLYDQKRKLRVLAQPDAQAKVADLLLMFDEMNPNPLVKGSRREFNLTIQDVARWTGISTEEAETELVRLTHNRGVEIKDTSIAVSNIFDMKRIVDSKANRSLLQHKKEDEKEGEEE